MKYKIDSYGYELTDALRERIQDEQFRESVYCLIKYVYISSDLSHYNVGQRHRNLQIYSMCIVRIFVKYFLYQTSSSSWC